MKLILEDKKVANQLYISCIISFYVSFYLLNVIDLFSHEF